MEHTTAARGEATDTRQGVQCPETTDQVWRSERRRVASTLDQIRGIRSEDIVDNEVAQTDSQRKFERLTGKSTEQFEQGTMQSSNGGTAMAAGGPAPEDSRIMVAAVAESATTQSTTSSTIRVVETDDQSNTKCQKVLASRTDRYGTIEDMDTCRAIEMTTDPEDCDGWTQQVVDWNKKCCGAKSGHLGHLFESQMVSERRIKELANIEKLEVVEIAFQETRARATEIVYARWLDGAARGTPEGPAADRSSEDATQVNPPNHEDEVQATTSITASRIIQSNESQREGATSFKECWLVKHDDMEGRT